jgi:hypothetical protein
VPRKMHRAKVLKWSMLVWVSELESETNSASGGGGWESAGNVPAAPALVGRRWRRHSGAAPCCGIDALATISRTK